MGSLCLKVCVCESGFHHNETLYIDCSEFDVLKQEQEKLRESKVHIKHTK